MENTWNKHCVNVTDFLHNLLLNTTLYVHGVFAPPNIRL